MSLATSDELVEYLRIPSGAESSTLLELALEGADEAIFGYCSQDALSSTTVTDLWLDGNGNDTLLLPNYPVSAISACSVYSDRTDTDPEVLVVNTDYVLNSGTGAITRIDGGVFTHGPQRATAARVPRCD